MSKLTAVFEMHIHSKMIILKQEQIFKLHIQYEVMKLLLNIKIKKTFTKSFVFNYFQKTKVYLEPSQALR